MNTQLTGQRVLVIGGAKHLGEAVARKVAEAGAVPVIAARDLQRAQDVAASLPGGIPVRIDITDESSIAAAAAELEAVDHIVITAAAHHNVPVTEMERDGILGALEAKVAGPLLVAKHFSTLLPASGSIVLFSGVAAWKPAAPYTVMGVANGAVAFLAEHLAVELAPIRVNAVSPGIIDSGVWDELGDAVKQGLLADAAASNLAGRVGMPDDIAEAVEWLLTAGFVTGETIHVEGGARRA